MSKWATPEFLEAAAKELVKERWRKVTTEELPETYVLQASTRRIGWSRGTAAEGVRSNWRRLQEKEVVKLCHARVPTPRFLPFGARPMVQPDRFADTAHHRAGMAALVALILTRAKKWNWFNTPLKYKERNS